MTYTVTELITDAYTLAQINMHPVQNLSGSQGPDGLRWLNEIRSIKSTKPRMIPYYKEYTFDATPGQKEYFIPHLLDIETYTFNIGDVRFSTSQMFREAFRGLPRVDNINSLPFTWNIERKYQDGIDGALFSVYFGPDQAYPIKIWAKFALDVIPSMSYDMSISYPDYYIAYLKFGLARWICIHLARPLPSGLMDEIKEMEQDIIDISPPDMSMEKVNMFGGGIQWTQFDKYAGGWRPVGVQY